MSLYGNPSSLQNATVGCATVAAPTAGTWCVDYTQQTAPAVAVADAVANGTTTLTSATAAFGRSHVGSVVYLVGGTGALAAVRREIASVTNATTVVLDAAVAAGTGITLNLGGCLDHFSTLATAMVASNRGWSRAGAGYTSAATITFAQSLSPTNTLPPTQVIGYGTVRGDNQRAKLTLATNNGISGINGTGAGLLIRNIEVDCANLGTSTGITGSGSFFTVYNCKVTNSTSRGIWMSGGVGVIEFCEVSGASGVDAIQTSGAAGSVYNNWVHDCSCVGIIVSVGGSTVINNIVSDITGVKDGIQIMHNCIVLNNTLSRCTGSGISGQSANMSIWGVIKNNILSENSQYGIRLYTAAGVPADPWADGNAYYANSLGMRSNMDDAAVVPTNGIPQYINSLDVILTTDPFVGRAVGDYRLNDAEGGGGACRGHGAPGNWPGNALTVGNPDMGAVGAAATAGAAAGAPRIGSKMIG